MVRLQSLSISLCGIYNPFVQVFNLHWSDDQPLSKHGMHARPWQSTEVNNWGVHYPNMHKWLYPLWCVGWNYLLIPKFQRGTGKISHCKISQSLKTSSGMYKSIVAGTFVMAWCWLCRTDNRANATYLGEAKSNIWLSMWICFYNL